MVNDVASKICQALYWGLTMPYMHYYACFFFGVSEVSSLPLVVVGPGACCSPRHTVTFRSRDKASKCAGYRGRQ